MPRFVTWTSKVRNLFLLTLLFLPSARAESNLKSDHFPAIIVKSSSFKHEGKIPPEFTCEGKDNSPEISWSNIPQGAESLALIVDDPDAPNGLWVHWVVYNIPVSVQGFKSSQPDTEFLESGGMQGLTDFGRVGYGGPCPPSGTHRYFFKVYALDTLLDFKPGATKAQVEFAMTGHILAQGTLMGKYKRKKT